MGLQVESEHGRPPGRATRRGRESPPAVGGNRRRPVPCPKRATLLGVPRRREDARKDVPLRRQAALLAVARRQGDAPLPRLLERPRAQLPRLSDDRTGRHGGPPQGDRHAGIHLAAAQVAGGHGDLLRQLVRPGRSALRPRRRRPALDDAQFPLHGRRRPVPPRDGGEQPHILRQRLQQLRDVPGCHGPSVL